MKADIDKDLEDGYAIQKKGGSSEGLGTLMDTDISKWPRVRPENQ